MPTRKIADAPPPPCRHPEHNPPSHMVFEPGTYKHTCPACGNVIVFTVGAIYSLHERPATERGGSWMANLVQDAMLRQ